MTYHAAHDRADEISRRVPEIAALYARTGTVSYFDNKYLSFGITPPEGYDPHRQMPRDMETKKEQLDDILWSLTYNETENQRDAGAFKEMAIQLAQKYLERSWLHTPWLTSRILTQVLDSELVPLRSETLSRVVPGRLTSYLPGTWGISIPAVLSFVYLVVLVAVAAALFMNRHALWGLLIAAYIVWHFGRRLAVSLHYRLLRAKLTSLCAQLDLIRAEVVSGSYDSKEIARRLRRYEEKGLYVHSLTYSLLNVHADHASTA